MENMTDTYCNNSEEERRKIFLYDKKVPFTMKITTDKINQINSSIDICAKKNKNEEIEITGDQIVNFDEFSINFLNQNFESLEEMNLSKHYEIGGKLGVSIPIKFVNIKPQIEASYIQNTSVNKTVTKKHHLDMFTVIMTKVTIDHTKIKVKNFMQNCVNSILNDRTLNTDKLKLSALYKKIRQFGYFIPREIYYGGKFAYEYDLDDESQSENLSKSFQASVRVGVELSHFGKCIMDTKIGRNLGKVYESVGNFFSKKDGGKIAKFLNKKTEKGIDSGINALFGAEAGISLSYSQDMKSQITNSFKNTKGKITIIGGDFNNASYIEGKDIPDLISKWFDSLEEWNLMPIACDRYDPIYDYFDIVDMKEFNKFKKDLRYRFDNINYEIYQNQEIIDKVYKEYEKDIYNNIKSADAGEAERQYKLSYKQGSGEREPFQWQVGINDQGNRVLYHKLEAKKDLTPLNYTYDKIEGSLEENEICVGWRIEGRWHDGTNGTWKCIIDPFLGRKWHFEFCSCFNRGLSFWLYIYYVIK